MRKRSKTRGSGSTHKSPEPVIAAFTDSTIAIGLGGNIGTREQVLDRFRFVVSQIADWTQVNNLMCSHLYESKAIGKSQQSIEQSDYWNAAVLFRLTTPLHPTEILRQLLLLEKSAGRKRTVSTNALPNSSMNPSPTASSTERNYEPRTIDVDLLLVGHRVEKYSGPPQTTVPHPQIQHRRFVLEPLIEIMDKNTKLPGSDESLAQLLARPEIIAQSVTKLPIRLL